jgi:hypothetical protein
MYVAMDTSDSSNDAKRATNQGRRDFLKAGGVSVAAGLANAALPGSARAEVTQSMEAHAAVQAMMPTRNPERAADDGAGGEGRAGGEAVVVLPADAAVDLLYEGRTEARAMRTAV